MRRVTLEEGLLLGYMLGKSVCPPGVDPRDMDLSAFETAMSRVLPTSETTTTAEVETQAAQSLLELERLWGQQGPAFTYTLPLCRGL